MASTARFKSSGSAPGRHDRPDSSVYGGSTAYSIGVTIDSRHSRLSDGTISNAPPRPCCRIDAASCTSTVVNPEPLRSIAPTSDSTTAGQSGTTVAACSSTILI